jgi:hypothetical protein
MNHKNFAQQIIALKKADLALRDKLIQSGHLNEGYDPDMQTLHNRHAEQLEIIIDTIGYPTIGKVGIEANEATWLIIQHAIGRPIFMKKCLKLLEIAVKEQQADPKNLAYLADRIAIFEGKTQHYGTQFDWDEKGQLCPNQFDNLALVNQRRKSIGLNTLEEQTEILRKKVQEEKQMPPKNYEKRMQDIAEWKKSAGWI